MSTEGVQKILAVDDSHSIREMVNFTLSQAGYEVVLTVDGQQALDWAKHNTVDLVLTDINMPNMDGITLITHLRTLDNYKYTPILVLTTESSDDKKMEGRKAGATGWIVKPFNPDKLINTVKKVLG